MNYPDSVEFLYALGNEYKAAKLDLGPITALVEELGRPDRAFRVVHVAGTNGKGSTCAMIESSLRAAGIRTGLYTSPHLVEPTERIRVDGQDVSHEQFSQAFDVVHQAAERLMERGAIEFHPTYFETVTAMAFVLFRDLGVETAVVEVGLGGRLDATNVVEPALTVVTPIDFDHEAFLGSSLESIAAEKAGIFKEGVPAVVSVQSAPALEVLESVAAERNVRLIRATDYHRECVEIHAKGSKFRIIGCNTLEIQCPLAGAHQIDNATTAVAALEALGISAEAIRAGIASAQWPGRLETVSTNPCIILDGAHNPAGARALAEYIREFFPKAYVQLIFGAMRDKSVQEITEILFPMADEVILTAPSSQRAIRPEAIAHTDTHPRLRLTLNVAEAIGLVKAGRPGAVCFITGSLYIVGEARALLVQ